MTATRAVEKYLSKYAEKEVNSFEDFFYTFENVLTIPAFDEHFENINSILNSLQNKNSLVILVVNAQINSSEECKKSNATLIDEIKKQFPMRWNSRNNPSITLHETKNCDLLLIDRSTKTLELPNKTGVGLARKIAADIATKLISRNNLKTNWIHCTDADVVLPNDYFMSTKYLSGYSATIYPYIHRTNSHHEKNKKSMLLYDLSLLHYVIGLCHAKSNFSYHTIGSTISIEFKAYSAVRGFPERESGEDFYILNKLAKIGKIKKLDGNPILIDGRISNRTPFGTGKSIEKISAMKNPETEFLFYNSIIFEKLKLFNSHISDNKNNIFCTSENNFLRGLEGDAETIEILSKIGAFNAIESSFKSSKNPEQRKKHFHTWFDSFKTLKFIHHMRDSFYPSIPLKELLQQPLYESLDLKESFTLEDLLEQFKNLNRKSPTNQRISKKV